MLHHGVMVIVMGPELLSSRSPPWPTSLVKPIMMDKNKLSKVGLHSPSSRATRYVIAKA